MFRRISVMGASGTIGSRVLRALDARKVRPRAITRWSSRVASDIESTVADFTDLRSVHDALAGTNVVVFAVSPRCGDPLEYTRSLLRMLRIGLGAARTHKVDRFVLVSSAATALRPDGVVDLEHRHVPGEVPDFVDAKYFAESECFLRAADGMNLSIVLPFLCVGAGVSSRLSGQTRPVLVSRIDDVAETVVNEALRLEAGVRRISTPFVEFERTVIGASQARGKRALRSRTGARDDAVARAHRATDSPGSANS